MSDSEKIKLLEEKLTTQSLQMEQLITLLSQNMNLNSKPNSSVSKFVELIKKPTKTVKKTEIIVDTTREALISKINDLGFKKTELKVEKLSNEQLQAYIDSYDMNFTDFDLLTVDGLLLLCSKREIIAKKSMSREKLISLLTGEELDKPDVSGWVLSRPSLNNKTLVELKQYCKDNGIKGYSTKKKDELIELILQ